MTPATRRNNASRHRRRGRRDRGLTLVELLLGLIITVVIGAAIASMLFAVSKATDDDRDLRALVSREKRASTATAAALRAQRAILDAAATRLVLWYGDADTDDTIDADELRALAYDAATSRLVWYEPNGSTPATAYTGAEDFAAVVDAFIAAGQLDAKAWATGVAAVSFVLDDADPSLAQLVSYRVTLREGYFDHESIAAVNLRTH